MWWKNNRRNTEGCVIGIMKDGLIQYCCIKKSGYVINGTGESLARNIRDEDYALNVISAGDRSYMENSHTDDIVTHTFSGSLEDFKNEVKDESYIYIYTDNCWLGSIYDDRLKKFDDFKDLRWILIEMLRQNITK